jgi:hypothetical protein
VALTYDGTAYPTVDFPSSVTLGTGGTMTFHGGNGFDVPSFEVAATIPGLGVITSPVPVGGAATVDTSQDLTVTWDPISIGQIHFGLDGGSSTSSFGLPLVSVACTFDGAAGAGVVPHALLSSLKAMAGTGPTYASLGSDLETTTVIDGLTIKTQSFQTSPTSGHDFEVTLE